MQPDRAIKIAVLAMGGEGGGVLVDWMVSAAQREGHAVQATSVPGVAQRTGATIYYLEARAQAPARRPARAGADGRARRRGCGHRRRADGSRPGGAARAGHPGPHHPDRQQPPRLLRAGKDHPRHRRGRERAGAAPAQRKRAPAGAGRHAGPGREERQRDLRQPVRRPGRQRRPALPAIGLRGRGGAQRCGRQDQPDRVARCR